MTNAEYVLVSWYCEFAGYRTGGKATEEQGLATEPELVTYARSNAEFQPHEPRNR